MSVEAIALVLHHSRARGTAKLVLIGIANHLGDGGAWPSIETLCKYAGDVDERNVQRALRTLTELGEVAVLRQAGGTRDTPDGLRPNRYEVLVRCPVECDHTTAHRVKPHVIHRPEALPGMSESVPPADAPPPGAIATPPPGGDATLTVPTNHPSEQVSSSVTGPRARPCRICSRSPQACLTAQEHLYPEDRHDYEATP